MSLPSTSDYPHKWGAMLAVGLSVFMGTIDFSIVNISLPTFVEELHTDFHTVQWVILSYALMVTALLLGMGRLGDMMGRKKLFISGLGIFTLGSLLCGLAPNIGWLIGFRTLQGLGAVMTQALGTAIITESFPPDERGKALGIIGGIVSVGLALGPALGGIIIGYIGWRAIFLVNIPVGIFALGAAFRFIQKEKPGTQCEKFDIPGALILLITLVLFSLGMTWGQDRGFSSISVWAVMVATAVGMYLFIIVENKTRCPMIRLDIFRNTLFSVNLVMGFLVFIVLSGNFILPFYLELVKNFSTEQAGLMIMVIPLTMGLVSPVSGWLSDRFGSRGISLAGLLMIVAGCLCIGSLDSQSGVLGIALSLAPFGFGLGFFQSPNNNAIMTAAPKESLGVASGLLALSRNLGGTAGVPLFGTLFALNVSAAAGGQKYETITKAPAEALVSGLNGTYKVAALFILAATVLAAFAFWKDKQASSKSQTI